MAEIQIHVLLLLFIAEDTISKKTPGMKRKVDTKTLRNLSQYYVLRYLRFLDDVIWLSAVKGGALNTEIMMT